MSKKPTTVDSEIGIHPAVQAWRRFSGDAREPDRLEILKESKDGRGVYRMGGAGPEGSDVVAKRRALGSRYKAECLMYERVLPCAALGGLRYYGAVDETEGSFGWFFVESAGAERYSPQLPHHRVSAGHWLGILHTLGAQCDDASGLPEREPYPAPALVPDAQETVLRAMSDPRFRDSGEVLRSILAHVQIVGSRQPYLEDLCNRSPRTVVHGDFVARNLCVRTTAGETELLAVDCEDVGWGSPLMDLHQSPVLGGRSWASADVAAYGSVVQAYWSHVDDSTIREWADCSTILRCVRVIGWEAPGLASEWPGNSLALMASYDGKLAHAMRTAGWI